MERLSRRFLNLHFGGGTVSVEATPGVLDELEHDLRPYLLAGPSGAGPTG